MTKNLNTNDKVFFITSNQSVLEPKIKYSLEKKSAYKNLNQVFIKEQQYKMERFTVHVFYFEIVKNEINPREKDSQTKTYQDKIILKCDKHDYEGTIYFKEKKKSFNTFFYDLKFKEAKGWFGTIYPPGSIKFSKTEQIKIYNRVLKDLKIKQGEPLSITLITDSLNHIIKQKYFIDFYL